MKNRVLFSLFTFLALGSGVARAYVPMIREDRIWEYKSWWYMYPWVDYAVMKFDGSTVQSFGKVYHGFRTIAIKHTYCDINADESERYLDNTETFEDNAKYFLREEDGKVYALCDDEGNVILIDEPKYDYGDLGYSEILLYDFTVPDNGTIESLGGITDMPGTQWKVRNADPAFLTIGGEECRFVGIYPLDLEDMGLDEMRTSIGFRGLYSRWIEGIGVLDSGDLGQYEYQQRSGGTTGCCLSSVYKTDGTLLYGNQPAGVDNHVVGLSVRIEAGCVRAVAEGVLDLRICGVDGAVVGEASGLDEVRVDTSALPHGVYVVTAIAGTERRTVKVAL